MDGACTRERCRQAKKTDQRSDRKGTGCNRAGTCDEKQILPEAKKIKEAGITLVLIDSKLSEDIADCTVSTDNYEAGRELGEYALSICSPEEKIGIVSHVKGSSTAKEREKGVQKV